MPFPEIPLSSFLSLGEAPWRSAVPPLFLLSLLTAAGAHLTSVLAEAAALAGRKAFRQKYALQASQMAFWAGIPFCCLAFFFSPPSTPDNALASFYLESSRSLPPLVFWILPALIHRFSWRVLRKHPGLHLCLGILTIPCTLGILAFPACAAFLDFHARAPWAIAGLAGALSFFLSVFAHCLALAFAAAASFCLPWLLLRRAASDYGRDYYAFALRAAARQALAATLAAFAAGALLLARHPLPLRVLPPDPILVACGLTLLCLIPWSLLLKSSVPLRHKPGACAACLLFPAAAYAQFLALWRALIPELS
jgi:hypothetical protein